MKLNSTIGLVTLGLLCSLAAISCAQSDQKKNTKSTNKVKKADRSGMEVAIFGTGCFWCTEAVFETLDGVQEAESGYAGGAMANPTYEEVSTGLSGHAECTRIYYDPKVISYADMLEAFFRSHDPTSLNRQGNDVGPQYRSVIFYTTSEQKRLAAQAIEELNASGAYPKPIVTQLQKAPTFYIAEDYHQDYFEKNPDQGYCAFVIAPKLDKFRKVFKDKLKADQ